MNKEKFLDEKSQVIKAINDYRKNRTLSNEEIDSLNFLVKILNSYTYANRLEKKGVLTRIVIDSLQIDYKFAEIISDFDNSIT